MPGFVEPPCQVPARSKFLASPGSPGSDLSVRATGKPPGQVR